jgi:formylglycine-generating enzyme required for sulfatase activity
MSKVFLSSTWVDLKEHRRAVIDRLNELRHQGYEVEWLGMEGFAARDEEPVDTCRRFVEQADIYVGIFGVRYGSQAAKSVRSMTEIEYRHAIKLKKLRLLFLIDEEHVEVKPIHYEKDPDGLKRLGRFKADVLKEHTVKFFTTPEDLAGKVVTALVPYLELTAHGRRVDTEVLRRAYLAELADDLEWLDFKGIAGVKEAIQLRLADIYVALRAMPYGSREEQEAARRRVAELLDRERLEAIEEMMREREEVQEALKRHPRLVVLGEPGSGKSTFLKYVAHALVRGEPLGLPDNRLPLLASVKSYAEAWQKDHRLLLETHLPRHIAGQHKSLAGLQDYLAAELEAGRCLVLLDSLDEVRAKERVEIARRVQTFARRYGDKGNQLVVTSRIEGYWEVQLSGDFRHYILSEFGPDEIRSFARQWCVAVERQWYDEEEARARGLAEADKLIGAILDWPSVRRLAANPLLLTIIALIHRSRTQLPHHRIKLYAICFETLVETWGLARSLEGGPAVGVEVHESEAVDVLGPLALWLHETRPGGTAPRQAIVNKMVERMVERGTEQSQARLLAERFLDVTREQCGLMAERGTDEYGLFHLTFEEYLAARDIARRRDRDRTATIQDRWPDPTWREIILLTAGQLGIMEASKDRVSDLLEDLLDMEAREEVDRGRNVVLAGRALVDVGKETPLPGIAKRVETALRRTMQDVDDHDVPHDPPYVPIRTRADAGEVLDELGWLPEDLDTFLPVPATQPAFWMARYPITNSQYERFIQAGGYREQRWWSDEGWKWRQGKPRWEWQRTDRPDFWDDPRWNRKSYPVVGVTWYEAEAYCNWLTERLQISDFRFAIDEQPDHDLKSAIENRTLVARLPTEEEWLLAAQGHESREYPWGDSFDPAWANTSESNLGSTTPVAMYPAGASTDGVWDMAGNVWEWTGSLYDEKTKDTRVLRGGSWNLNQYVARCAFRLRLIPDYSNDDLGFRVVVSPGSP